MGNLAEQFSLSWGLVSITKYFLTFAKISYIAYYFLRKQLKLFLSLPLSLSVHLRSSDNKNLVQTFADILKQLRHGAWPGLPTQLVIMRRKVKRKVRRN